MLEFTFARKYLIPNRKRLSVSLIACLSCLVISLVIWLLLLFLSITEGIEKNWLNKMTSLNAPIRIVPNENYYRSDYYLVDTICQASSYSTKSIYEKLNTPYSNPYNPEIDEEIPPFWQSAPKKATGEPIDLVKESFQALHRVMPGADYIDDYQVTAGMLKLKLLRPSTHRTFEESYISQASYISTWSEKSQNLSTLLLKPTLEDVNHLLDISERYDMQTLAKDFFLRLFTYVQVSTLKTAAHRFTLPHEAIQSHQLTVWIPKGSHTTPRHILIPLHPHEPKANYTPGILKRHNHTLYLNADNQEIPLPDDIPLLLDDSMIIQAQLIEESIKTAEQAKDVVFDVHFQLQRQNVSCSLPFKHLYIQDAFVISTLTSTPHIEPLWPYKIGQKAHLPSYANQSGVLVPKNLMKSGLKIGDKGVISYNAFSGTSSQEMQVPIFVSGFYDPGPMAIGARYILAARPIVETIASANVSQSLDPLMANGINVWVPHLKHTPRITEAIQSEFQKQGIASYFSIIPYYEFEFARDLIQQLKSDRHLFSLVGILILGVACCNIISLLLLLVNDKKKEIGILIAMGTSRKSIGLIFAFCGLILGAISFLIGSLAAWFTLQHIDTLVSFLSFLQGQAAFNVEIYGEHLPSQLSKYALIIIGIATPFVSLLAGLIPALYAAKTSPTQILRNE